MRTRMRMRIRMRLRLRTRKKVRSIDFKNIFFWHLLFPIYTHAFHWISQNTGRRGFHDFQNILFYHPLKNNL